MALALALGNSDVSAQTGPCGANDEFQAFVERGMNPDAPWLAFLGPFDSPITTTTVHFTESGNLSNYPGLTFPESDDAIVDESSFADGKALSPGANGSITIQFDEPQAWFGIDHNGFPGIMSVKLNGNEICSFFGQDAQTNLWFIGAVGTAFDIRFDEIVIAEGNKPFLVDDLRYGTPRRDFRALSVEPVSGFTDTRAVAVNDAGNVVGFMHDGVVIDDPVGVTPPQALSNFGAFFYSIEGMAGFAENTTHDLGDLAETSCSETVDGAIARGMNNANIVVGEINNGTAFVWKLGTSSSCVELPDLAVGEKTRAFAINDEAEPIIVGNGEIGVICLSGPNFEIPQILLWWVRLQSTPPTQLEDLLALDDFDEDEDSNAFALAVTTSDGNGEPLPLVVGYSDICGNVGEIMFCGTSDISSDPSLWDPDGDPTLAILDRLLAYQSTELMSAEIRGVNDADMAVGFSREGEGTSLCPDRSILWQDTNSNGVLDENDDLLNLHAEVGLPALQETFANSINEKNASGHFAVVGRNSSNDVAAIWQRRPASQGGLEWAYEEIPDFFIDNPCPPYCPGWTELLEATDVSGNDYVHVGNRNAIVVGWGLFDADGDGSSDGERGFVIRPFNDCGAADYDNDCDVDNVDLAQLLAQWGAYTPCPPYRQFDFDVDCDVDAADLAQLLARWGECDDCELDQSGGEGFAGSAGGGESESSSGAPAESASLEQALNVLGYEDTDSFIEAAESASSAQITVWMILLQTLSE